VKVAACKNVQKSEAQLRIKPLGNLLRAGQTERCLQETRPAWITANFAKTGYKADRFLAKLEEALKPSSNSFPQPHKNSAIARCPTKGAAIRCGAFNAKSGN